MRIPVYICIPLAIGIFTAVLWFGAHDTNFTTEPSDAEITAALSEWKSKHPSLPPRERIHTVEIPKKPKPELKPEFPAIPQGELSTRPALDHYSQQTSYPTESFQDLAINLENKGKLELSLLAWERSIDHCENAAPQRALKAIAQLRDTLPIWNADHEAAFPLTIHIHTPSPYLESISPLKEKILITLVSIQTKFFFSENTTSFLP